MGLLKDKKDYGDQFQEHLLSQWITCVEMANYSSDRRISANNFYMTVNAALLAVITFSADWKNCLLAIVGIVVSILWIQSINNYKKLNEAKYAIINSMEQELPSAPFTEEWANLRRSSKYRLLTTNEKWVPWVFVILFAIVLLLPFGKWVLTLVCPCINGGM